MSAAYFPGEIYLPDHSQTMAAGQAIGQALNQNLNPTAPKSQIVTMTGPLGAGKTTLCQGLAKALGVEDFQVVSPSFTLVNIYQGLRTIYHIDLYRLGQRPKEEFYEAGLEECLDNDLCLVEWADRLSDDFWPEERLDLEIDYNQSGRWLRARGSMAPAWDLWRTALDAFSAP
ncbi:MAG: tRNA (adenosine(37)-N6)-threonylcarbamoyltransferase complex ATPase subunit type 1 TsaE [Deltaproteobacteria bacterium]|nr:tRNA (adenosine(37)-N6)-threonylcarbamoyltransferase complex ATPase subunit type 1 TsaE [Deltaproteobacteria bacterium]